MSKVEFKLNEKNKYLYAVNEVNAACVGTYYPAADYEALEAKLARLVDAAELVADYSTPLDGYLDDIDLKELKAAINAAKGRG